MEIKKVIIHVITDVTTTNEKRADDLYTAEFKASISEKSKNLKDTWKNFINSISPM